MKGRRLIVMGFLAAAALAGTGVLAQPSNDSSKNGGRGNAGNGRCQLHSDNNRIQHVVYIQFDNVHFRRDLQNIPSDLEQMSNLRNFLVDNGTVLTDHHTPLISHTSVDILTTLTGVYGEKMGAPIGNSLPFFKPTGTASFPSTFEYWTDPLETTPVSIPVMVDQQGKIHPAPWVPFTRAGCDVGAFSVANIEFENITTDVTNVFGAASPEAAEAKSNPTKAKADFLGIAVHCAQNSPICSKGRQDVLTDEPGGYQGFNALFGGVNVQPAVSPRGPVKDIDGNVIADASGNPGFPNTFDPSASQTLGYLATMLEAGIPVVYGYIEDMHDNHASTGTFGPGEAEYVAQLAAANEAFGKFFARLAQDGITKDNTLFVVTADENDKFVGGAPSPANCDGVHVACTYQQIGEIDANLSRLLATQASNTTPFSVHSDSAPTFYINGNPGQTDPITRQLERDVGALTAINPITGNTDKIAQAMADQTEQRFLHMVTSDPNRTPNFVVFANDNYFNFASGTDSCDEAPACVTLEGHGGFAWNHGDFQEQITKTWLGLVGPGVQHAGPTDAFFSDHTDTRPTIMGLVGLKDDYAHDGRVLFEVLQSNAVLQGKQGDNNVITRLAEAYKDINAPVGRLGRKTFAISTAALNGDDATYTKLEAQLTELTNTRNKIAQKMIDMLEGVAFDNKSIDKLQAELLIIEAEGLVASVH
jgi:arylsulfatase A-like enzyme